MSTAAAHTGFRLTGWHVLAIIVGFFAIVFAVNVGFAFMAVKTFPGEVSVTPYEDGVAYNAKLAQMAAQERLGWRATAAAERGGAIVVTVSDRAGAPLRGLAMTAVLDRPATEAWRKHPAFAETTPGTYVAHPAELTGAWDLSLVAHDRAGHRFEAERRLSWP